ncbi:MAG: BrnT family toxin [Terriglobia bacterium]
MTLYANGVDWDTGSRAKCEKHGLSASAIESLFTRPLAILPDAAQSQRERRFRAIGRTEKRRGVFIVFTLRRKGDEVLIRPISARYMHKKEIEAYEKENPDF